MAIVTTAATATAHLTVLSARAAHRAGEVSTTSVLAGSRLEQLQSLPWWFVEGVGGALEPRSDATTDLSREPIGSSGPGLSAGPPNSLLDSAEGYAEYLDRDGLALSGVGPIPTGSRYVRRWSVLASRDDPDHTLVLGVRVTPIAADLASGDRTATDVLPGETWLVTLRTRTRP